MADLAPRAGTALVDPAEVLALLEAETTPATRRAYRQGILKFAAWCGDPSPDEAARRLLAEGPGPANALVLRYRAGLLAAEAAPATVNLRLAALRALVRLARVCGLVTWSLDVRGVRVEVLRDTRGPGVVRFRKMLRVASRSTPIKAARDGALLRLLGDLALRRAEVEALDVSDVETETPGIWVKRKGKMEKERLGLPTATWAALSAWLAVRPGGASGALFLSLDRRGGLGRLTGSGLYRVVRYLGDKAGVRTRPHGLRHTAITVAVERAAELGRPLMDVLAYSGHAPGSVGLLVRYRDVYDDHQGQIASLVADEIGGGEAVSRGGPAPREISP